MPHYCCVITCEVNHILGIVTWPWIPCNKSNLTIVRIQTDNLVKVHLEAYPRKKMKCTK